MDGPSTSEAAENKETAGVALEITDKLRVLCLHGYRQNGDAFKSKLGSFRKHVGRYADFVFVTAPHQAPPLEADGVVDDGQRSWWANKDDGTFKGTNKSGPAFGFQKSLRLVEEAWKAQGPFQGLLGFSQGACFAAILCGLSARHMTVISPEFVILASGFKSGSLVHMNTYEEEIAVPSLHIYGQTDDIIPQAMSKALSLHFRDPEILEHGGGHYFPATAQLKQTYINYFQDRLQDYLEKLELRNNPGAFILESYDSDENETAKSDDNDSL